MIYNDDIHDNSNIITTAGIMMINIMTAIMVTMFTFATSFSLLFFYDRNDVNDIRHTDSAKHHAGSMGRSQINILTFE